MNVKVSDLMAEQVITASPTSTVEEARGLMKEHKISALPVVGEEGDALGIVTSTDLAAELAGETPLSTLMGEGVHAVPAYNDVNVAARIMRKNKVHHVVVTHEKKVVGILSSFDLLKLVEGKRFVMKDGPTPQKGRGARKGAGA